MKGWRLYALMIGLAAFTGAGVALVLSGGLRSSDGASRASPTANAAVSQRASPTATSRQSSTFSPTPSPTASSSGAPDLTTLVRSAGDARRIAGTTLLLSSSNGIDASTLVAVPVTTNLSSPTPSGSPRPSATSGSDIPFTLGIVGRSNGWQLRADATLLAISLATASDAARLATWNLRTDAVGWLTPDESGVRQTTPVWSLDGSLLYYASSRGTTDLGVWRIRADGTQKTLIRRPDGGSSTISLQGLTPDGTGLYWSYLRASGSANVLDLQSGTDRAFDDTTAAAFVAWRQSRPRALVTVGGGAAQPPGTLTLWDDTAGTKKVLLGPGIAGSPDGVYGADFDPTGTRIVIAAYSRIGGIEGSALNLIDLNGGNRAVIAGSEGAQQVLWFRSGIVFTRRTATGGTDVMLISPTGGTPVTLYSDPGPIGKLTFVSP